MLQMVHIKEHPNDKVPCVWVDDRHLMYQLADEWDAHATRNSNADKSYRNPVMYGGGTCRVDIIIWHERHDSEKINQIPNIISKAPLRELGKSGTVYRLHLKLDA